MNRTALRTVPQIRECLNAIRFCTRLFDRQPMIKKDDYVKWDVEDPAINFVIETGVDESRLDNLSIQVASGR